LLDLNETVDKVFTMVQRLVGENIALVWMPGAALWQVKIDPSQVDQILMNLIANARDAIAGVGTVRIETRNINADVAYCAAHPGIAPGEYVRLAIADDGCGMDRETLANIFEPFYTTKELGKGTGLGLATVYGIVQQNKGSIHVDSQPGEGTTFTIHLPRYLSRIPPDSPQRVAEQAAGGSEVVLLVEDEPMLLELVQAMLEKLEYTVLTAGSPGEALRLAEEHVGEIHLLMTDVVMPEMNGRDLAKRLLSLYPKIRRLFMSGYTADVIAYHGVLEEAIHFIQKPFTVQELAVKVRKAFDQNEQ
jgi:CheY-like chemotaxis protein